VQLKSLLFSVDEGTSLSTLRLSNKSSEEKEINENCEEKENQQK